MENTLSEALKLGLEYTIFGLESDLHERFYWEEQREFPYLVQDEYLTLTGQKAPLTLPVPRPAGVTLTGEQSRKLLDEERGER